MRHYPHPYKPNHERATLGSVLLMLTLGAVLLGGWHLCKRNRRHPPLT